MHPLILVVDDEPGTCRMLEIALTAEGFEVVCAGSAAEAKMLAGKRSPDIALIDIVLRGEDGLELTQSLKADYPQVHVIAMTARDFGPDLEVRAKRSGTDELMMKPFDLAEMERRIWAVLAGEMPRRQS